MKIGWALKKWPKLCCKWDRDRLAYYRWWATYILNRNYKYQSRQLNPVQSSIYLNDHQHPPSYDLLLWPILPSTRQRYGPTSTQQAACRNTPHNSHCTFIIRVGDTILKKKTRSCRRGPEPLRADTSFLILWTFLCPFIAPNSSNTLS